jgi:lipopolysaccharide export system permease protein
MRLTLADRYILSELVGPLFLSAGGFLLFMVANIVFLMVDDIVNKHIPFLPVLEMLLLRVPAILVLTFPVAMLFAGLLGLGKLAADQEIMAMRTAGISFFRLSLPVLGLSLFLVIITFITNNDIAPWSTHKSQTIVRQILERQSLPPVEPNVFIHGPNNTVFYIGGVDRAHKILYNVMIYEPDNSPYPRLVIAKQARYDGKHFFLFNGSLHEYNAQGLTRYEASFDEMMIPVTLDPSQFAGEEKTPFEMNVKELRKEIALFKKSGISTSAMATDYYFKFSLPFGCFIAALIGIPLGVKFPRSGRFVSIALAVFLLFVYYCLFSISRALGIIGMLPPVLAAWLPNLILGGAGIGLLLAEESFAW